jgi:hypothetical protein
LSILALSVLARDAIQLGVDLHQDSRDPAEVLDDVVKRGTGWGSPATHPDIVASFDCARQMVPQAVSC